MTHEEYLTNLDLLKKYQVAYYTSEPLITDFEYDNLIREVKAYEELHPKLVVKNSATQQVGTPFPTNKIQHMIRMWSMEDIFNIEELSKWLSKRSHIQNYIVMPKYDGCSLNLIYQEGKLVQATTRGDGIRGEDVTFNAPYIQGIPLTISYTGTIEIRGEVVIAKKDFEHYNESRIDTGNIPFFNPRNLASSTVRYNKVDEVIKRKARFIPWGIGYSSLPYTSYKQILDYLSYLGFYKEKSVYLVSTYEEIVDKYNLFTKHRNDFIFQLDGMVIRADNINQFEQLGTTEKFPKGLVAFKFLALEKPTYLRKVSIQVGRTGVLTPVGILDPVMIDNTKITRVTLNNFSYIEQRDLHIGDKISIIKSGDIIPKLASVFTDDRSPTAVPIHRPTHCPMCNTTIVHEGLISYCPNSSCKGRVIATISHYASKDAMDIYGLAHNTIIELYEHNLVTSILDLYKLQDKKEELLQIPKLGNLKIDKLFKSIERSKTVTLDRFIFALGIPNVGNSSAKLIAKTFKDDWNKITLEELSVLNLTEPTKTSYIKYIEENQKLLQELIGYLNILTNVITKDKPKVLITGTFEATRKEIASVLEANGYEVLDSFSKAINYLLVGDNPGNKLQKAIDKNIPIVKSVDELLKLNNDII